MINICREGKYCGWNEHGEYECHCHSPKTNKISIIKEVLEKVNWEDVPRSAWDHMYIDMFEALYEIKAIVEDDETQNK